MVEILEAEMKSKSLFEPPLAHSRDPQTSFDAADKMVKSGKLRKQQKEVYEAILAYPNTEFTAKELSRKQPGSGLNYWQIQRRLNELANKFLIARILNKEAMKRHKKIIYKQRDGCCVWRLK